MIRFQHHTTTVFSVLQSSQWMRAFGTDTAENQEERR